MVGLRGARSSALLKNDTLGVWSFKRFAGQYHAAGAPAWTSGELLADTVRRMNGRRAPAVVLTEIDFETLDNRARRLLFVSCIRATLHLELVLSKKGGSDAGEGDVGMKGAAPKCA